MGLFTTLVIIFAVFVVAAGIVSVIIAKYRNKEEEKPDRALLVNFNAHRDKKGCLIAREIDNPFKGSGNRNHIPMTPLAITKEEFENEDFDNDTSIIDRNKIISISVGDVKNSIPVKILLPAKPDEFPEKLKETFFGKGLQYITALKEMDNSELEAMDKAMQRAKEHMKEYSGGEYSSEMLDKVNGFWSDMIKKINENKQSSGTTNYPSR